MIKRYASPVLHLYSDEAFGEDAVEQAIVSGYVSLTYKLNQDRVTILGKPSKPKTGQYLHTVEAY